MVSSNKRLLTLVINMNNLIKKSDMRHSEIKIKAIRKKPTIRIKRKNNSTSLLQRIYMFVFKHLGLVRRAH